ncbi:MAG: hypothetical protein KC547_14780 [Anaerolineae bacterium]|nr:hypothetical protein [Anaerolineae bacterium]
MKQNQRRLRKLEADARSAPYRPVEDYTDDELAFLATDGRLRSADELSDDELAAIIDAKSDNLPGA